MIGSHHHHAEPFALYAAHQSHLCVRGKFIRGRFLQQQIRQVPEIGEIDGQLDRVHPEDAAGRERHRPFGPGVAVPLPLPARRRGVEFVIFLRRRHGISGADIRFPIRWHRLADAVAILVDPDDRHTASPLGGLKMDNAAVRAFVLKMDEPPFTLYRIDKLPDAAR